MSPAAGLPAFLVASVVLAVTPGPGVVYLVTRTLAQGRAAGFASVAGVGVGNLCNAVVAALGLAALFAVSEAAFQVVKWAGAAWLVVLGVRMLLARQDEHSPQRGPVLAGIERVACARLARDGFLVALLNPKTTLFFAAFLPQFMDPGLPSLPQALRLDVVFVAIAACTDALYVLLASACAGCLPRSGGAAMSRLGRRLGGTTLIVLGLLSTLAAAPAAPRRPA